MKERCVITPSAHPGSRSPCSAEGNWNLESDDRTRALAALRRGLDLGLTHVDTAELYGNGAVETLVGEALVGRRDEVYLVSKVLPSNASRGGTLRACERSLRRLQTDHLDLYLLHWPGAHPLAETVAAFDDRVIEHAVIPWCEAHGVSVVAYSPFGSGQFPGTRSQGGRVLAEGAEGEQPADAPASLSRASASWGLSIVVFYSRIARGRLSTSLARDRSGSSVKEATRSMSGRPDRVARASRAS
jgi:aryl-alcohol dehydrogenase-like predicted oxidoreductase